MKNWPRNLLSYLRKLSTVSLFFGTVFFCVSLTPSLLPRTFILQGILSGVSFSLGYALGLAGKALWLYMQLPIPSKSILLRIRTILYVLGLSAALLCLFNTRNWQNSIRELMAMPILDSGHIVKTTLIAVAVTITLFVLSNLFIFGLKGLAQWLKRFIPPRVANVLGITIAIFISWAAINRFVLTHAMQLTDSSLQQVDQFIDPDMPPPQHSEKAGNTFSLISWETLGRQGRNFVTSGPNADTIASFTKKNAQEPIRIYAGLSSAQSPEERAKLALEELKRTDAFKRKILIIVTPTGTGWIDEQALDTVEYLHHGNIASVAVQYSYLPSWLSLWVEPEYGLETALALFDEVYHYWTQLPKDTRPRLYIHGLSLGALNSQKSSELYTILADPYHGALWSGPPFASSQWRTITAKRQPDSPAWLPVFQNSALIRFANQYQSAQHPDHPWGPMRIVYLQYASDPIVFISPSIIYQKPEWLKEPRGPDVSPKLRWFPLVTFLQLSVDVILATVVPLGYGHLYAPQHYIDAWIEVTQPPDWSTEHIDRLKIHFQQRSFKN